MNIKNLDQILNFFLTKRCYLNHNGNTLRSILAKDSLPVFKFSLPSFKYYQKPSLQ